MAECAIRTSLDAPLVTTPCSSHSCGSTGLSYRLGVPRCWSPFLHPPCASFGNGLVTPNGVRTQSFSDHLDGLSVRRPSGRSKIPGPARAARAESPTLLERRKRTLSREEGGIRTSGDGRWYGTGQLTQQREERWWRESEGKESAQDGREQDGAAPLPWFSSKHVYGGLLEKGSAGGHLAKVHRELYVDGDGWKELHTAHQVEDLDDAKVDFQVLQRMLRQLRNQGGGSKAERQGARQGPSLQAERLQQEEPHSRRPGQQEGISNRPTVDMIAGQVKTLGEEAIHPEKEAQLGNDQAGKEAEATAPKASVIGAKSVQEGRGQHATLLVDGEQRRMVTKASTSGRSHSETESGAQRKVQTSRKVWRREAAPSQASAPPQKRSFQVGRAQPRSPAKHQEGTVDEALVSKVVSFVSTLLQHCGSITFSKIKAVLEPWAGKLSQRDWDKVVEVLEHEENARGALAVLGWMVGRHAGVDPDIERALSSSGKEAEDEPSTFEQRGSSNGAASEGSISQSNGSASNDASTAARDGALNTQSGRAKLNGFTDSELEPLTSSSGTESAEWGYGEQIRIDAGVLDEAVGDTVCSCRLCASSRASPPLSDELVLNGRLQVEVEVGAASSAHASISGGVLAANGAVRDPWGVPKLAPELPQSAPRKRQPRASFLSAVVCKTAVRVLDSSELFGEVVRLLPLLGNSNAGHRLYKAVITQLAREGRAEEALSLLLSAPQRSILLYNVVMDACSKAWLGHERVVALFDLMASDGLEPTVQSCNIVLSALVRENMLVEASRWMDEMRVRGCKPDAISYNTLLGARIQFKAARELFEQMLKEGVSPNLRTFNVLIALLAAVGDYDEAKKWVRRMKGMGIEPSQVTFNSVITACLNGGSGLDEALCIVEDMEAAGFSSDVVTFNILIGACSRFGWLEEREDLLADMEAAQIRPNDITRKMLALHRPDDLERGFRKKFEVYPLRQRPARNRQRTEQLDLV